MSFKQCRNNDNISTHSTTSKDFNFDSLINNEANLTCDDDIILIWCDASISKDVRDDQYSFSQLRLATKSIHIFTNEQKCLEFISESRFKNKLFLIVSGSLGKDFVPKIYHLSQINSIYIFCGLKTNHEIWAKEYKKIKGVFDKITELCECLKRDKQQLEMDRTLVDFFSKKISSSHGFDELINLKNSKHNDHHQPKDDIKIVITSAVTPFSNETSPVIKEEDEEEINNNIHPSKTVAPYTPHKQQMEFSDTGIWPCVSVIDSARNELVNHLHSSIENLKHFNSIDYFLQHLYSHPIDPHLIVLSNPTTVEHLSTLILRRVRRVYIYCSNTRLNEYDTWSKRYPNIVSVLQHFHSLTRLIIWDLSACIVDIGNYYDSENKRDLAQVRYCYAYRLHFIIQADLNNRIEMIEYNQSAKCSN